MLVFLTRQKRNHADRARLPLRASCYPAQTGPPFSFSDVDMEWHFSPNEFSSLYCLGFVSASPPLHMWIRKCLSSNYLSTLPPQYSRVLTVVCNCLCVSSAFLSTTAESIPLPHSAQSAKGTKGDAFNVCQVPSPATITSYLYISNRTAAFPHAKPDHNNLHTKQWRLPTDLQKPLGCWKIGVTRVKHFGCRWRWEVASISAITQLSARSEPFYFVLSLKIYLTTFLPDDSMTSFFFLLYLKWN